MESYIAIQVDVCACKISEKAYKYQNIFSRTYAIKKKLVKQQLRNNKIDNNPTEGNLKTKGKKSFIS